MSDCRQYPGWLLQSEPPMFLLEMYANKNLIIPTDEQTTKLKDFLREIKLENGALFQNRSPVA